MKKSYFKKKAGAVLSLVAMLSTLFSPQSVSLAAPDYNYGEALQKAIMFYEFQMAGKQPDWIRNNWRGDATVNDGKDVGADLSKGWFDAGDHVKFNLPMSYSVAMLAWSIYENKSAFEKSGQLDYLLREMKWATDYLVNCHPEPNVYYFEVGHGGGGWDHKYWGAAETVEQADKDLKIERITYKADLTHTATAVVASTSAALASASLVFKEKDPAYSQLLLKHAQELYTFADTTKSTDQTKCESAYAPVANDFYKSWSGCYDQLSWACVWLYYATGDTSFIEKAESYVPNWDKMQDGTITYKWGHNWDNVLFGTQLLLARITKKPFYIEATERNLDWWTVGYKGEKIKYTPKGLAWLDSWGCLRYATTTAFLASVYADGELCPPEKATYYKDFAKKQVDYALGSSGRSYVIGFGTDYPKFPHHRTAHGSWCDDKTMPNYSKHVIVGALVGGPGVDDVYKDDNGLFQYSEVACDYNAAFVGVLAKMYGQYGGSPIPNYKAIEEKKDDEYFVDGVVGGTGTNFVGIKATLRNRSAWPARVLDKMSIKYFIDLSELTSKGIDPNSIKVSSAYNEGAVLAPEVLPWDKDKNIYYVDISFPIPVYPGGQSAHRKEVQFRIEAPNGAAWDNTNDFSFQGIPQGATAAVAKIPNISVYNDGMLIGGNEPPRDNVTPTVGPTPTSSGAKVKGYVDVDVSYSAALASGIKSGFKVEAVGSNISTVTDENGYFELGGLTQDSQEIKISKQGYLARSMEKVLPSTIGTVMSTKEAPMMLWAGDLEIGGVQDGAINMSDIMEVAKAFNSSKGDLRYSQGCDPNQDGAVNMADIMTVAKHFNATKNSYIN